jgi:hypothetical protein
LRVEGLVDVKVIKAVWMWGMKEVKVKKFVKCSDEVSSTMTLFKVCD